MNNMVVNIDKHSAVVLSRKLDQKRKKTTTTKVEKMAAVLGWTEKIGYREIREIYYREIGFGVRIIKEFDTSGNELSMENHYFINQNINLDDIQYKSGLAVPKLEGKSVPIGIADKYLMEKIQSLA
jgi:hypothetical protein